jgi:hypothetical protein
MRWSRVWPYLLGGAIGLLDLFYARSHPGAPRVWNRLISLLVMAFGVVFLVEMIRLLSPIGLRALGRLFGLREEPFFAYDPNDAEQRAADRDLDRIVKLTDADAYNAAYSSWLEGERRREEARFVRRRERAIRSPRSMKQYLEEIQETIKSNEVASAPGDPDNDLLPEIERLRSELAWAEHQLESFGVH